MANALIGRRQQPDKKQHNIAALEKRPRLREYFTNRLAPAVGFEPTTNRLIPTVSGLYH